MLKLFFSLLIVLIFEPRAHALFGEELGPLFELVSGQVTEIEKLTESIGVAQDQMKVLKQLNDGVDRALAQIRNIEDIISRTKDLDPRAVRSLSDLNDLLQKAQHTKAQIDEMMLAKINLADEVITQSAMQSDTAFKMGQEMVATGSALNQESVTASPGRASQISAASSSAQMLAQGIELQTLAQLVQVQTLNLEFQKSQALKELQSERIQKEFMTTRLTAVQRVKP
ncbi:hypothetical protein K2X30_13125 [bacterium]|nr:hypothetical protein [bacterium]